MTTRRDYEERYKEFFIKATGIKNGPYPYQVKLATAEPFPELLDVPTGLGKTAAVVLGWLWRRRYDERFKNQTPRRLVYCLPMRVLVEQTHRNIETWLRNLNQLDKAGSGKVSVHLLMGGEEDMISWVEYPEEDMILIGTQDMLLSRALMRGYGMSRYQWPIHFALLHNDSLWIFDEVQLMGAGLPTSTQLDAFRRIFKTAFPSRSLWVSATLNKDWLATVDMRERINDLSVLSLSEAEMTKSTVSARREAIKHLKPAKIKFTTETAKQSARSYIAALAEEVLEKHQPGTQTLVVLNTVERTQAFYRALSKQGWAEDNILLVHSRFRPLERRNINNRLVEITDPKGPGRIVVATQAIEAGVDISCRVLFTELAPWSSLVQRFGRCNRYGEWNKKNGADVFWVDIEAADETARPYDIEELTNARTKLKKLKSASPVDLPKTDESTPLYLVLRRKDFLDLFNTDPDLSGYDVDISFYIRDADDLDLLLFWRDLSNGTDEQPQPYRDEICRASIGQVEKLYKRLKSGQHFFLWDSLAGEWRVFRDKLRPGLTLMLDATIGGYDRNLGFQPEVEKPVDIVLLSQLDKDTEVYDGDHRSIQRRAIALDQHLRNAEDVAYVLCNALGISGPHARVVALAARWHDVGKAHSVFQATMHRCKPEDTDGKPLLAKSTLNIRHVRPHFRHELASAIAWLEQHRTADDVDLIAYLIAAHHGKVRLSLRAMPEELEPQPPLGPRFARGIWEGDNLPGFDIAGRESIAPCTLRLDLMELGEGDMGPSWMARTQKLIREYGPLYLAWLEALVRIADWRATRQEQENTHEQRNNS